MNTNGEGRFLNRVLVDITNKCNLRCRMCGVPADPGARYDMPLDLFDKIAAQTFPKTREVWLSCGYEAMLSKHFLHICKSLKDVPYSVLISNGTLMNETIIDQLIRGGLKRLMISFDGATKKTFETIRRGADFERVLANIDLMAQIKRRLDSPTPEVCFTTTLMRTNIEEFSEIVQLAVQHGIRTVYCKPVQALVSLPEMASETLDNQRETVTRVFKRARDVAEKLGVRLEASPDLLRLVDDGTVPEKGSCSVPTGERGAGKCGEYPPMLFIFPDGRVQPCTRWSREAFIGDFKSQNFQDIWDGQEYKKLRVEIQTGNMSSKCLECRYLV